MRKTKKNTIEKIVEAPALILEKGIEEVKILEKEIISKKPIRAAEEYWETLGPGLTTGAADDDPSGIATYSQAGAKFGYQFLWMAPITYPLMSVVQEMCARIGMVTGQGLAKNIKLHYPKSALYFTTGLLFFANTFNIGADLGMMAKSVQLLLPGANFVVILVIFTLVSILLQIFTTYERYARILKYLTFILFSYVFSAFSLRLNLGEVLNGMAQIKGFFTKDHIYMVCAILGTTISPYLFFWQSSQEVEEDILKGRTTIRQRQRSTTAEEIKKMRIDVWSGMFISNIVMFFIILACAGALFNSGITNIESAEQAAQALRPFAGDLAFYLFTLGIIGIGLLSVPVLAGSGAYALAESFGWKNGLYRKLKDAYAFYGLIIFSMVLGLLVNFSGLDPIKTLILAAIINGISAPVFLFFIVSIARKKKIMGKFSNSRVSSAIVWLTISIMVLAGGATLIGLIF